MLAGSGSACTHASALIVHLVLALYSTHQTVEKARSDYEVASLVHRVDDRLAHIEAADCLQRHEACPEPLCQSCLHLGLSTGLVGLILGAIAVLTVCCCLRSRRQSHFEQLPQASTHQIQRPRSPEPSTRGSPAAILDIGDQVYVPRRR